MAKPNFKEIPYKEITLRLEDLCKNPDATGAIKLTKEALSRTTADNQDEVIELLSNVLLDEVDTCHTADSLEKADRLVEVFGEIRHVEGLHDSFSPLARTIAEATLRLERKRAGLLALTVRRGNPKLAKDGAKRKLPAGITAQQKKRKAWLVAIPDKDFDSYLNECRDKAVPPTKPELKRFAREKGIEVRAKERQQAGARALEELRREGKDAYLKNLHRMTFQAWDKQLKRSLELDAIVCDPPWDKKGVDANVFRDLARFADRHLKRDAGAPLVVMIGEKHFSRIYEQLLSSGKFRYRWSLKVVYSHETKIRKPAFVNSRVKLVLVLQRINEMEGLSYLTRDLLKAGAKTKVLSNEKESENEDWQQDPETFEHIIRLVCKPGASIADPTMGWGTTGVAAVRCGMKFFGCEMKPDRFKKAAGEIALELKRRGIK